MKALLQGIFADFSTAWQLLTAVPLPFAPNTFTRPAGKAVAYYPLVGFGMGLLLVGTGWIFYTLLPARVASALVLVVWVALTGMLHLDGFMDACDGLLPPRDPTRRLEIMKDSRVGAFGVVGGVLLLLVKFSGLASLPDGHRWVVLICVPVLGRWGVTWAMAHYPLARKEGLGVFFKEGLGWTQIVIASIIAGVIVVGLLGLPGVLLIGVAWVTTLLVARLAIVRVGGLTGDIYGTICESVEAVMLITIVALLPLVDFGL